MAVELTHRESGFVVTIHDPAELPTLTRMAARVPTVIGTSVVVDVSELMIAPHGDARLLVETVQSAAAASVEHRWSLVATRLSARRVLRQLCTGSSVHVYPSVDMALAASAVRG